MELPQSNPYGFAAVPPTQQSQSPYPPLSGSQHHDQSMVAYLPAGGGVGQWGPVGAVRSTGVAMLLFLVTFGFYGFYWWFVVHDEMKRHRGTGIGGGIALVLAIFISPVAGFLTASEVSELYTRNGWRAPVSTLTGLWYFPGSFILVGQIIWFVHVNNALNEYWRSLGVR